MRNAKIQGGLNQTWPHQYLVQVAPFTRCAHCTCGGLQLSRELATKMQVSYWNKICKSQDKNKNKNYQQKNIIGKIALFTSSLSFALIVQVINAFHQLLTHGSWTVFQLQHLESMPLKELCVGEIFRCCYIKFFFFFFYFDPFTTCLISECESLLYF